MDSIVKYAGVPGNTDTAKATGWSSGIYSIIWK